MNITLLKNEEERIFQEMEKCKVDDPAYDAYRKRLAEVQALRIKEEELEDRLERSEREMNMAEVKAKAEISQKEEELRIKDKDSKRNVGKVFLFGGFTLAQMALTNYWSELKPMIGKAWNYVWRNTPKV